MHHSRLIRLLSAFSKEEINDLAKFIQSPLFNDGSRPQKTQALLEYLKSFHPIFESDGVRKEQIFKAIFQNEVFQESKLDKVVAELIKVIRKFIVIVCSDSAKGSRHWLMQVQFFRKRGMDGEFYYSIEQAKKFQQKIIYKDEGYFFNQFCIEAEQFKHLIKTNNRKTDVNIPDTIRQLDLHYIITKIEYCSYLIIQDIQTRLESPKSFILLNEVLKIAKDYYLNVPIVAAYHSAYSLLLKQKGEGSAEYYHLKKVLKLHSSQLSRDILKPLHSYMRNYIADSYNQGDTACLPELMELYKDHIRQGTIYQEEEGYILASTLKTAVTVALKLGEHQWAADFLETHRHRITGADEPEAIYQFNLANCHFHRGDFAAAETCLAQYNFREMFYKLAAKRLEIKLYYETRSPLLEPRLDAFKIFVHDAKSILPPDKIEPNNHFTDLMRQIIAPKTLGNAARIEKLIQKLHDQKAVAEREWLMEKLNELKAKV